MEAEPIRKMSDCNDPSCRAMGVFDSLALWEDRVPGAGNQGQNWELKWPSLAESCGWIVETVTDQCRCLVAVRDRCALVEDDARFLASLMLWPHS